MATKKIPVAIQLYSLRSVSPTDLPGTLGKIAEMGYQGVEFAGYYDLDVKTLRKMLDDRKLVCAGSHISLDSLEGDAFEKTVSLNKTLGTELLIISSADLRDLARTIARMSAAHARAKAAGMRLGFHNHMREFEVENGRTKYERLFSETPADFISQLDIGWAASAGQDVAAILRKYGPRIETVHVREFSPTHPKAAVGEGTVKWPELFDILEKETAVRWYVVEQEQYAVGPLESARTCIDNIRKMGR